MLNNNDAYYVNGNVGFGTPSPHSTVDILGTAKVTPGTYYFARGDTLSLHNGNRCSCDTNGDTEDCAQGFYAMTNESGCTDWFTVDAVPLQNKYDQKSTVPSSLFIGTVAGVGIGTDSPTERLEVVGRLKLSDIGPQIILNDTAGVGARPRIRFLNNSGNFDSDDRSEQTFNFYSLFSNERQNNAKLRVFGNASNWGTYTEITHDGIDGRIATDTGDLVLAPISGNTAVETDLEVSGDLLVSGAVRGNIGPGGGSPFPRPAYDSGWVDISQSQQIEFTHNVGVNANKYVVDLQFTDTDNSHGINQVGYGRTIDGTARTGAYWHSLTTTTIKVVREKNDIYADKIRVRIWLYN
jgi:hypothetical protein